MTLEILNDFFDGEIYKNKCIIVNCPDDTWDAIFLDDSKNMHNYDSKDLLLDDLEHLGLI